jgi:hypothetical protein
MCPSTEELAQSKDVLRRARVDSQIEGQFPHPDDAAVLDAMARGEFDNNEARRRIFARITAENQRDKNGF